MSQEFKKPSRTSYLEKYPHPLGQFKSSMIIHIIREKIENRFQIPRHQSRWLQKTNISFAHGILLTPNAQTLKIIAFCKSNDPNSDEWDIKGKLRFTLHNWVDDSRSVTLEREDAFFQSEFGTAPVTMNTHVTFERLLERGFVKDDKIWIATDFRVQEVSRFHQPMVFNYRSMMKNWVAFQHLNDTVYCSKEIISAHTKGTPKTSFAYKKVYTGSFEQFLDIVHGSPLPVLNVKDLVDVLKDSESFGMRNVIKRLEPFVIYQSNLIEYLGPIAVEYNLRRVMHAWINSRSLFFEKADLETFEVEKISGEMMKAIVKKVFEADKKKSSF
ncbi:hypothetical protein CRE_21831 [Caenorhabditis remanei]|uniref:BTB domain-containing protein n=1 Tax=Caenorhabditis remanei TaxID=31234 RepID=E3MEQ9_CAERE|nr:hypothetical protein CRE_21831 [Caenorhabditis remanei]